ncbi:hypothetical protein CBS101457_001547 [Exobasidium rhododendri]|nr:hypothetical protein CBS101457_001547 [Exobasidium rhododendri]
MIIEKRPEVARRGVRIIAPRRVSVDGYLYNLSDSGEDSHDSEDERRDMRFIAEQKRLGRTIERRPRIWKGGHDAYLSSKDLKLKTAIPEVAEFFVGPIKVKGREKGWTTSTFRYILVLGPLISDVRTFSDFRTFSDSQLYRLNDPEVRGNNGSSTTRLKIFSLWYIRCRLSSASEAAEKIGEVESADETCEDLPQIEDEGETLHDFQAMAEKDYSIIRAAVEAERALRIKGPGEEPQSDDDDSDEVTGDRFHSKSGMFSDVMNRTLGELKPKKTVKEAARYLKISPLLHKRLQAIPNDDARRAMLSDIHTNRRDTAPSRGTLSGEDGLVRGAIEAITAYLVDSRLPTTCDLMKELAKDRFGVVCNFQKGLTTDGRKILDSLLRGALLGSDFDNEENLLDLVSADEGGIYVGFGVDKDGQIEWLYVGRSCGLLFRNASHQAYIHTPVSSLYMPCYHYRNAKKTLEDGGKVFYKQVSSSRKAADQFFWETVWCFLLGTFQLGSKGEALLRCRHDAGLPAFSFIGVNSTACYQASNWNAIFNLWNHSKDYVNQLQSLLVKIYQIQIEENLANSVLQVDILESQFDRAQIAKDDLAKQLATLKKNYLDETRRRILAGTLKLHLAIFVRPSGAIQALATNFHNLVLPTAALRKLFPEMTPKTAGSELVTVKLNISDEADPSSDIFLCRTEQYFHLLKGVSLLVTSSKGIESYWQLTRSICNTTSKGKLVEYLEPLLDDKRRSLAAQCDKTALYRELPLHIRMLMRGELHLSRMKHLGTSSFKIPGKKQVSCCMPYNTGVEELHSKFPRCGVYLAVNFDSEYGVYRDIAQTRPDWTSEEVEFSQKTGIKIFGFDGVWKDIETPFPSFGSSQMWSLVKEAWNALHPHRKPLPVEHDLMSNLRDSLNVTDKQPLRSAHIQEVENRLITRVFPQQKEIYYPSQAPAVPGEFAMFKPTLGMIKKAYCNEWNRWTFKVMVYTGQTVRLPASLADRWGLHGSDKEHHLCAIRINGYKRSTEDVEVWCRLLDGEEWTELRSEFKEDVSSSTRGFNHIFVSFLEKNRERDTYSSRSEEELKARLAR